MITAALLGTLTGGLTSIIPGILGFFQRRDELKHERSMAQIQAALAKQKGQIEIDTINARADANEGESLRKHDASLPSDGFMGALQRSVRPVITYLFFFTFIAVKGVVLWAAVQNQVASNGDWLNSAIFWSDIMPVVWDDQTAAIFGAIMGFWFGGRTIDKLLSRK